MNIQEVFKHVLSELGKKTPTLFKCIYSRYNSFSILQHTEWIKNAMNNTYTELASNLYTNIKIHFFLMIVLLFVGHI